MKHKSGYQKKVLMLSSVASMIDQFNMSNIRMLLKMEYEVHVACNFKEGNTCDGRRIKKFQKALEEMCVVWHQWDCPRNVWPVWKCCRAYRQLLELARQHAFVWIHCHSPVGGVLARLVAHRRKIRVAYTAHGFHFYKGAPLKSWLLYYPVEKLLSRWTDVLITVNKEDYCFAMLHLEAGKVFRIPGIGIDTERFAAYDPKETKEVFCRNMQIPEDANILLSVGELSVRKNHSQVLPLLQQLDQNVYYVVCGQGELREYLEGYALKLGIQERVRLLGFQEELRDIYKYADIFVFPSLQEGLPAALMEAMASGLPCVVSDIRGNRELIDKSGGIRVPLEHPGRFRKAVQRLLDDEARRQEYGRYNQRKIRNYDQEIVYRRMKKIYEEL